MSDRSDNEAVHRQVVILVERDVLGKGPVSEAVIEELRKAALAHGIYGQHLPVEYGGQGLSYRDMLLVFEVAGRDLLAAPAFRAGASDEGNMPTLELFGTERQK